MDITELRSKIDSIDNELVRLFTERMDIAAQVADYKKENNLPIYVPAREREILEFVRFFCDHFHANSKKPVTVGVASAVQLEWIEDRCDVLSFHDYYSLSMNFFTKFSAISKR